VIVVVLGGRLGDYIRWVDSRLFVLSRLAMCRFGSAVVISNIQVVWSECRPALVSLSLALG